MSPIVVGVLVGILILSFLVSRYVATSLRMPDHGWKAGLIAFLIGISALIVYFEGPPKQGVDLKGGTILVYEVDEDATKRIMGDGEEDAGSGVSEDMMKGLVRSLSMRINPGGVQETVIRQYGAKQIEIVIPNVGDQEIERIKEVITKSGFLEFLIVANRRDHQDVIELADEKPGAYEIKDKSGRVVGRWVGVAVDYVDENGVPQYKVDVTGEKTREVRGNLEVLMYVDSLYDLDGEQIRSVRKGMDQRMRPAIFFNLDARGSQNMAGLTEKNKPNSTTGFKARLGIVMDNELISAPSINSVIVDSGTIEGNFSDEEVQSLVEILNAGSLPAILKTDPISESTVNPLLGADTIRQGKLAIGVSLAGVLVFMLIYYRFAGVVASAALLLNLLFILAAMIFLNAAFSLPGLAGLVLTVGMSVDANVLIFERIREERQNGGALRMAIRNGFARAMPTILDANVTNLITALVLYGIGGER
ncbi:MAG: protein translocase subunit SecD, partial [Planctomycetales bacterium]|nr:protein translocase subunit SecD [Planctomycetales bacterium]